MPTTCLFAREQLAHLPYHSPTFDLFSFSLQHLLLHLTSHTSPETSYHPYTINHIPTVSFSATLFAHIILPLHWQGFCHSCKFIPYYGRPDALVWVSCLLPSNFYSASLHFVIVSAIHQHHHIAIIACVIVANLVIHLVYT